MQYDSEASMNKLQKGFPLTYDYLIFEDRPRGSTIAVGKEIRNNCFPDAIRDRREHTERVELEVWT